MFLVAMAEDSTASAERRSVCSYCSDGRRQYGERGKQRCFYWRWQNAVGRAWNVEVLLLAMAERSRASGERRGASIGDGRTHYGER